MVLIYLNDGRCIEVPRAIAVERSNSMLYCLAQDARVVASFDVRDVQAFTANVELAELIKDELCIGLEYIEPEAGEERGLAL